IPGQTFTVGVAGQLVGIELAPLIDTIPPTAIVFVDLLDGADQLIGTAARTAEGFPPGGGVVPEPLAADAIGSGYFDRSSLGVMVEPGTVLGFRVRHDQVGLCDENSRCVGGAFAGGWCDSEWDCLGQMRVGESMGNAYPDGVANYDDGYGWDLVF